MKKIIINAFLIAALMGCQDDDAAVSDGNPSNIQFQDVYRFETAYSTIPVIPGNHVFNDAQSWNDFAVNINSPFILDQETGESTSVLLDIDIDFTMYTVIAVLDELRNSGGYNIDIVSVTGNEDKITVDVETSAPQESAPVTAVMTQPCHFIKIPKTALPVEFE